MPLDLKTLREEFGSLHKQNGDLLKLAHDQKRDLTAEETQQKEARFTRMDQIQKQVDDDKRMAGYAFSQEEVEKPGAPRGKADFDQEDPTKPITFDAVKCKDAINRYIQTGDRNQLLKFTTTTGSDSGVLLPTQVLPPAEVRRNYNAIRKIMAYRGVAPIVRNMPVAFSLPLSDDTGNTGQQQSEGATSGTSAGSSFSNSIALNGALLYSSKQDWFSNTLIMASDFDVLGYVGPKLQKRIDKIQESDWTTKLLAATVGKTVASASAITYAEWIAFEHSLKNEYRMDAGIILSDTAFQLARALVDSNGRPIMDTDPQGTFQYQIHGLPVAVGDYFATVATTAKVGCIASADALKVLDVSGARLTIYRTDPNHPDQTGFELFQNGDMGFDPNGVRLLKMG